MTGFAADSESQGILAELLQSTMAGEQNLVFKKFLSSELRMRVCIVFLSVEVATPLLSS